MHGVDGLGGSGGGGGGGGGGGQSRHTCPFGRHFSSHPKKSLKLMPAPSDCLSNSFSFCAQRNPWRLSNSPTGSHLRYESSMASSSPSLMVPDPSASAIWKSATAHSLNSSDQ